VSVGELPLRALGRGAAGVLMAASSLRVQVMESKLSMSRSEGGREWRRRKGE